MISIQTDLLDAILVGLLPLAWTVGVWWLLNRRLSPLRVIGFLFVIGIDLTYLGLAGESSPLLFSREWLHFVIGGQGSTFTAALLHLWPPLLATLLAVIVYLTRRYARRES